MDIYDAELAPLLAVVIAIVIAAFAGFEITWDSPRLSTDYLDAVRQVRGETTLGRRIEGDPAREAELYALIGSARVTAAMTAIDAHGAPRRYFKDCDSGDETR